MQFDIVHVHMGRDPASLVSALIANLRGANVVIQTHGMVEERKGLVKIIDATLLRWILRRAQLVLALTPLEGHFLTSLGGGSRVRLFGNGTPMSKGGIKPRDHVVILFLSRLHPRKGAAQFARVCRQVDAELSTLDLNFLIAGPDEGDLTAVREHLQPPTRIKYIGAQSSTDAMMHFAQAHIYVLPAENEPFGMTIVEAMTGGAAIILNKTAKLAPELVAAGAAISFDGSDEDLRKKIQFLIMSEQMRSLMSSRAQAYAKTHFDIEHSVDLLENLYQLRPSDQSSTQQPDRGK